MIKRLLPGLAVFAFYLLVAGVVTWPLASQLSTHLVGWPYGDSHEMARHIWWYNHALRTGQPIFWQPALGYPDGMEGVLLWAHPQQFFPAWLLAFVLPIPAAANLSILLYMALNGWGMYVLAQHLLDGRRGPALLAGLAYMAAPTFQGHLGGGHAGLMVAWTVPLYVWALLRLEQTWVEMRRAQHAVPLHILRLRWFWLAVLFFILSPGGHILQLIYVLLPISGTFALVYLWRRQWGHLLRLIAVNVLGSAALLVFVLPIAQSTFETSAYTEEGGFVRYSADLLSIATPSFFNPLYAGLDYPRRVIGTNLEEGISYVGILGAALALIGVIRFRRARWWLLLAFIAWGLSLGPLLKVFDAPLQVQPDGYASAVTLPWAALQNLPLFNLARTPGRFNFALALAVAALAGYGAAWLWDRMRNVRMHPLLIGFLMVALLVDYQVYWPFPTHDATIPAAVYGLAERDDIRAVLDLPWNNPVAAKDALYLQTAHRKPLIAGHVTRSTPVSPAKLNLLESTLDPVLLDAADADVVILHTGYLADEQVDHARQQLGQPLYEDDALVIFLPPDPSATPSFTAQISDQTRIERSADSYVYALQAGWVDFSGTLTADGRTVELYRDQVMLHRWQVDGDTAFAVPVPVEADRYHVIRLVVSPPCPAQRSPALTCRAVQLDNLNLQMTPESTNPDAGATFEPGVRLLRSRVPSTAESGDNLPVRLWWALDSARSDTDIRFVHVVDDAGEVVAQDDQTLGAQPAGAQWAEQVDIALPDTLPPGRYRVYTGWYTYPAFNRFAVLTDGDSAAEGLVLLSELTIP
ncbi:MAG: hypothetical protein CL610_14895 [Anaerolineaceae bacterium]|nr:hypothetical protein [Anaerolineaceae bacterium]